MPAALPTPSATQNLPHPSGGERGVDASCGLRVHVNGDHGAPPGPRGHSEFSGGPGAAHRASLAVPTRSSASFAECNNDDNHDIRIQFDVSVRVPRCAAAVASTPVSPDVAASRKHFQWISRTMWVEGSTGAAFTPAATGCAAVGEAASDATSDPPTKPHANALVMADSAACNAGGAGMRGGMAHFHLAQAAAAAQLHDVAAADSPGLRLPHSTMFLGDTSPRSEAAGEVFRQLPSPVRRVFSPCESSTGSSVGGWDEYSTSDGGTPGSTASGHAWDSAAPGTRL